jgi:hypothetical protein
VGNCFVKSFAIAAFITGGITPVSAQSNQTQEAIGTLGNLFGALAQAGAKSKAKKGWATTSEPVKVCVNMMLASKNLTVDKILAAGVAPTDQRVATLVTFCDQVLAAQLQTNIACNVSDSKGKPVSSTCNQVFAKNANGTIVEISRDDFIRAAGNGENVQIGVFETLVANAGRLQAERRDVEAKQREVEAERQRFLASPEGKRQAAAEALRAKQAAATAARDKAIRAAEAARAPRGYLVACKGSVSATQYNVYSLNCGNPSEVINGFRWAIAKLNSDGSGMANYYREMAKNCLKGMYKYSNFPYDLQTNDQIIWGSLSPCNAGLQDMSGPSLAQSRAKR